MTADDIKKIKPTADRILVAKAKKLTAKDYLAGAGERTQSGIILVEGVQHVDYKPNAGSTLLQEESQEDEDNVIDVTVLAVGPDCKGVKKGDKGLISKYSGLDIFKDQTAILLNEKDILAIL